MNKRFILRKFEMKYYSSYMHKVFVRKRKIRNLRFCIFLKIEKFVYDEEMGIWIMYRWGFKIYKMYLLVLVRSWLWLNNKGRLAELDKGSKMHSREKG